MTLGEPDPEPEPYIGWGMGEPEPSEVALGLAALVISQIEALERAVNANPIPPTTENLVLRNRLVLGDLDPFTHQCSCPRCVERQRMPGTPQQRA